MIRPKKSLGQHFLNSKHVLEQIISAGNIQKGEKILEIGPGTGILTRALLDAGANVVAIEKDDRAATFLNGIFSREIEESRLKMVHGDILEMSDASLVLNTKHLGLENGRFTIVANIPYYITGAILEKFLEHEPRPDRMVLLVQKEVADRIVAHDSKESVLSISVKAFGIPKIIAKVPPGAFTPPPTVDSAILLISEISDRHFSPEDIGYDEKSLKISRFFDILKAGFAHKRKFLMRNLETIFEKEKLARIWEKNSLDMKVRAEDMSLDQWFAIAEMSRP